MRMSCNGCRVLRKGCSENCSIRPCLQWIKSPDSQGNATVFLAKFYGRAGLMNLINAGPDHLRPAIFRSLLYEACGRIVNPIYGSVGLLWSGQWQLCQNAVEAVLKGVPITPVSTETAGIPPPAKAYDIRHVIKDENSNSNSDSGELNNHKLKPTKTKFKRPGIAKPKPRPTEWTRGDAAELNGSRSTSHDDSSVSHPDEVNNTDTSMDVSVETVEKRAEADVEERENDGELELDLTLGFGFDPVQRRLSSEPKSFSLTRDNGSGSCNVMDLGLV